MYPVEGFLTGSVVVPIPELAAVRRQVRKINDDIIERAYDEMKRFRVANPTESMKKLSAAIKAFSDSPRATTNPAPRIACEVLKTFEKPRAGKWSDFITFEYSKATVNDDIFPIFWNDGTIVGHVVFQGRRLTWFVCGVTSMTGMPVNVQNFKRNLYGTLLYRCLSHVQWRRGSGGGEIFTSGSVDSLCGTKSQMVQFFGESGHKYDITDEPEMIKNFLKNAAKDEKA